MPPAPEMRKVYHSESSSTGLIAAIAFSIGITGLLFGILPFSHIVAKPTEQLELRKAGVSDLPPPEEELPPPSPPQEEAPQDAPAEPELAETPQAVPLTADLDVAVGAGGALAGFGEVRAMAATEAATEETFDVADLEKRPEPISQFPPTYPAELRKARIDGQVTLVFVLTEDGRVEDPRIETSSRPEFEKPALEAIRKWRFRPGMKDGQPVRSYIRIPMRFRVTNS